MSARLPLAILLTGAVAITACASRSTQSDTRADGRIAPTTPTVPETTSSRRSPTTVSVPPPPPPAPPTTAPPPITIQRDASGTAPDTTGAPLSGAAPVGSGVAPREESTTTTRPPEPAPTRPGIFEQTTIRYSPPGAEKRKADLVIPQPRHADTIIVLLPDRAEKSGRAVREWANYYARRGYPSLTIHVLVSEPDSPSPVYPKPERDVKAAVQYLRARAGELATDRWRIVVQGFGFGAGLGAHALVSGDDPYFDGASRYEGESDHVDGFIGVAGTYDGSSPEGVRYYGGPPDSPDPAVRERYQRADSIAHASSATGPAFLFHASGDDPALSMQGARFDAALSAAGKDSTLTLVSGTTDRSERNPKAGPLTPAGRRAGREILDWLSSRFPSNR